MCLVKDMECLTYSQGDEAGAYVHLGDENTGLVHPSWRASQVVLVVKNLPANAGDIRDMSLIPGSGRSPGGGHGNPLQYSCLGNILDRGAW